MSAKYSLCRIIEQPADYYDFGGKEHSEHRLTETAHTLVNAIFFTAGSIVYNCSTRLINRHLYLGIFFTVGSIVYNLSTRLINRHLYSGIFKDPLDTKYKVYKNRLNSYI